MILLVRASGNTEGLDISTDGAQVLKYRSGPTSKVWMTGTWGDV